MQREWMFVKYLVFLPILLWNGILYAQGKGHLFLYFCIAGVLYLGILGIFDTLVYRNRMAEAMDRNFGRIEMGELAKEISLYKTEIMHLNLELKQKAIEIEDLNKQMQARKQENDALKKGAEEEFSSIGGV